MSAQKGKPNSRRKANILIAINTMFVIFGLASGFTGTMAWFNSQRSYSATAGSFSVSALPGTEFDLYYLDYFWDVSVETPIANGNYDAGVNLNCGYEIERSKAAFAAINYDGSGNVTPVSGPSPWNPTEIVDLWPAHQLTFAIVITTGSFSGLRLNSWSEETSPSAMAVSLEEDGENELVHLAWAINLYGRAYHLVPDGESSTPSSIETAYSIYHTDRTRTVEVADPEDPSSSVETPVCPDRFPFSQDAPISHDSLCIVANNEITEVPVSSSSPERTVVFFTVEFSDTNDVFYSLVSKGLFQRDPLGNSNCYENLSLTELSFALS